MLHQKQFCLLHFGDNPWGRFKVTMTEQERKVQLEKLVIEITSLQIAIKAKDPSLARGVYLDTEMMWLDISKIGMLCFEL